MENSKTKNDFLKVADAAEYLGVSTWTLRNWDKAGKLKPERHPMNGYRIYKRADLEAILNLSGKKNEMTEGYEKKNIEADMANEINKAKSEFLANMNHELRTPLNAIMGLSNLLQVPNLPDEKRQEFTKTLHASAEQLLQMINGFLDDSKPQIQYQSEVTSFDNKKNKGSNLKVLLVEDYEANILVASTMLDSLGYSYEVAKNGIEALEKLKKGEFGIVLMDVQMPEMDGFEATEHWRKWEAENNKTPVTVIGMTAYALQGDKERCLRAGMDYYISKPFDQEDLEEKLKLASSK